MFHSCAQLAAPITSGSEASYGVACCVSVIDFAPLVELSRCARQYSGPENGKRLRALKGDASARICDVICEPSKAALSAYSKDTWLGWSQMTRTNTPASTGMPVISTAARGGVPADGTPWSV